jgi:RNA polymerase sigma-70 factor (ECF subfamily)
VGVLTSIEKHPSTARLTPFAYSSGNIEYGIPIPMPDPEASQLEDSVLIERAREGDDDAYRALVTRHLPSVYTFSSHYMGNSEDAQDAAQETFLKAWKNLERFDTSKSFRTWLFAIAKNTATDLMRKRKSVVFSKFDTGDDSNVLIDTLTDTEPLPDELFAQSSNAEVVRAALQKLKQRDQTILMLRYDEEQSFEDIAKILKMSANTVRSLHRRALIQLKKTLQDTTTA